MSVGGLIAPTNNGVVSAATTKAGLALTKSVRLEAASGLFLRQGELSLTDTLVNVAVVAVNKPKLVVSVRPGLSLPTASRGQGLRVVNLGSKSVDPSLGATVVYGEQYSVLVNAVVRAPVYKGADGVLQGVFVSSDLWAARRMNGFVVYAGPSVLTELGSYSELSAVVGTKIEVSKTVGVRIAGRLPAVTEPSPKPYAFAINSGITYVFRKKPKSK